MGFEHTVPLTPSWVDHNYSCDYVYEGGTMRLWVGGEFSSVDETTAYFDSLAETVGGRTFLENVGEDAYSTTTGTRSFARTTRCSWSMCPGCPSASVNQSAAAARIATAVALAVLGCWIEN